jgi:carbon-monoxide dehydrogenase large subunit
VAPVPLEPRGILVRPEADGRYTVWNSTQSVHRVRAGIAHALGIPEDRVRAVAPDVGGGFGAKTTTYREEVVVAAAARRLGRPVKWHATRMEDLQTTPARPRPARRRRGAFDADGSLARAAPDVDRCDRRLPARR